MPTHGIQQEARLTKGKLRAFGVVMVLFPVAFLAMSELLLRAVHYGPDLELFTSQTIGDKDYLIINPDVKGRYFSKVRFSPNTSPDFFLKAKPPGTLRIFCLGGSTTVGFPYGFNASFSTFLRDHLQRIIPDRRVEVVNLGMTATNSYTVNDIASEVLDLQPDLIIVYDGHNEFYGALGVGSQESLGSNRWVVKTYLHVVRLRLFQLVRQVVGMTSHALAPGDSSAESGTMMERLARGQYIPLGSAKYTDALRNFKANLEGLRDMCASRHVPLLLGTQVSNLRNQYPFVSEPESPGVTKVDPDSITRRGIELAHRGHLAEALAAFRSYLAAHPERADAHFRVAVCLDTLGEKSEARKEYVLARDEDMLRFRASSDFNAQIRGIADDTNVYLADIDSAFTALSPDSIVGRELILEHLHPNLAGYFDIAATYFDVMAKHSLLFSREEWQRRDTVAATELWKARPVTALDMNAADQRLHILMSSWPFRPGISPQILIDADDTLGRIAEELVLAHETWEQAHVQAAEFYAGRHALLDAEAEYRTIINQVPVSSSAYLRLAQLLITTGEYRKAEPLLAKSLDFERTFFALRYLGAIALDEKRPKDALPFLTEAFRTGGSTQERLESGYLLALALSRSGDSQKALETLGELLRINPGFSAARALADQIQGQGK